MQIKTAVLTRSGAGYYSRQGPGNATPAGPGVFNNFEAVSPPSGGNSTG